MLTTIITAAFTALVTSLGAYLLARHRMRREFLLQYKAETVARKLLNHPTWRWRTFKVIEHHLGGFEHDELRKILVQAGAVRFETQEGEEIWGLYDRVGSFLEAPRYPAIGKAFTVVDEAELPPRLTEAVRGLLSDGRRDEALARVRAATGLGLPEAETIVERLSGVAAGPGLPESPAPAADRSRG